MLWHAFLFLWCGLFFPFPLLIGGFSSFFFDILQYFKTILTVRGVLPQPETKRHIATAIFGTSHIQVTSL
jgi:hypothetical protein